MHHGGDHHRHTQPPTTSRPSAGTPCCVCEQLPRALWPSRNGTRTLRDGDRERATKLGPPPASPAALAPPTCDAAPMIRSQRSTTAAMTTCLACGGALPDRPGCSTLEPPSTYWNHHRPAAATSTRRPGPPPTPPPPAWLERLPAAELQDGVEVACHGGGADSRRGQGPFKTAALGPATKARQPRHQRRHNVLRLCRAGGSQPPTLRAPPTTPQCRDLEMADQFADVAPTTSVQPESV